MGDVAGPARDHGVVQQREKRVPVQTVRTLGRVGQRGGNWGLQGGCPTLQLQECAQSLGSKKCSVSCASACACLNNFQNLELQVYRSIFITSFCCIFSQ